MPKLTARKPQDLAAVVRAAREEAGISQAALAERLALTRDYVVDLESGKLSLQVSRLMRVFHELGVTVTLDFGNHDD